MVTDYCRAFKWFEVCTHIYYNTLSVEFCDLQHTYNTHECIKKK